MLCRVMRLLLQNTTELGGRKRHLGEDVSAQLIAENFITVPLEYDKPQASHLKVHSEN